MTNINLQYPSGTAGSIFYSEPVPSTYTFTPEAANTNIPAPAPTAAKRWQRVRKDVPRADMM